MQPDAGPYPNPNGQWVVGYSGAAPAVGGPTLTPYSVSGPYPSNPNVHCFYVPSAGDNLPSFCQNFGTSQLFGMEPDQIALHPYQGAYQYSVLRWYAPKPGVYEVNATFLAGEAGSVEALVYVSGGLTQNLGNTPVNYLRTVTLSTGSYVDIIVGPGTGGFLLDSTPLDVTISDVRCIGDTGCVARRNETLIF